MSSVYDTVLSNTISLNPTGTLDFKGTFSLNGANNLVQNTDNAAESNLNKTANNEIICGTIENFENNENNENNENISNSEIKNLEHKKIIYLLCVFIFIFLIFYLI